MHICPRKWLFSAPTWAQRVRGHRYLWLEGPWGHHIHDSLSFDGCAGRGSTFTSARNSWFAGFRGIFMFTIFGAICDNLFLGGYWGAGGWFSWVGRSRWRVSWFWLGGSHWCTAGSWFRIHVLNVVQPEKENKYKFKTF